MKKLIIFLIIAGLFSCKCIGQLPLQTIYAGQSCEASLPDYTKVVAVSDNCRVESFIQIPSPGTLLTADNPQVEVLLRAKDNSGNNSESRFTVVLLDTIPPAFHFPDSMLSYTPQQINGMYLAFETSVKEMILDWAFNFQWDAVEFTSNPDTVWYFNHAIEATKQEIQAYKNR
jgi:hypothetical protein